MKLQTEALGLEDYIVWFTALILVIASTGNSLWVTLSPTAQQASGPEQYERKLTYREGVLFKTNCSLLLRARYRNRPDKLVITFLEPSNLAEHSYYSHPNKELCKKLLSTNSYSYYTSRNYDNIPRSAVFQIGTDAAERGKSFSEISQTWNSLAETGIAISENALFFQILDLNRNNKVYISYKDSLSRARVSVLMTPHLFTVLAWLSLFYLLIIYRQKILAIRESLFSS